MLPFAKLAFLFYYCYQIEYSSLYYIILYFVNIPFCVLFLVTDKPYLQAFVKRNGLLTQIFLFLELKTKADLSFLGTGSEHLRFESVARHKTASDFFSNLLVNVIAHKLFPTCTAASRVVPRCAV